MLWQVSQYGWSILFQVYFLYKVTNDRGESTDIRKLHNYHWNCGIIPLCPCSYIPFQYLRSCNEHWHLLKLDVGLIEVRCKLASLNDEGLQYHTPVWLHESNYKDIIAFVTPV